jgi:hypothetical protein
MILGRNLPPSWRSYQLSLQRAERRARARQRMQVIGGWCLIFVLACVPAALIWLVRIVIGGVR